ncbi:MAG: class I SAM-dependent methyltransferase [bacterium]
MLQTNLENYKMNLEFWEAAWQRVSKAIHTPPKLEYVKNIIPDLKKYQITKILDLACGSGWLSFMLGEAGFTVRGVDTSESAIKLAKQGNAVNVDENDENAGNGVVQRSLDETVAQRAVSRLRRTNDRSVLLVHEDHEDDENAENGVVQRSLDVEFYCADILDMDLTEKDFDCVIMNACLEHFDLASAAQLLANLKKHLKPQAYIYGVFDMVATSNKGEFICFDDGTRQYLDPMRKGMYLRNYSDEDLTKLFTEAGFQQLSYTTVDNGSRVVVLERSLHSVQ